MRAPAGVARPDRPVRRALVGSAEPVELRLQLLQGAPRWLPRQPALDGLVDAQGLVEALDPYVVLDGVNERNGAVTDEPKALAAHRDAADGPGRDDLGQGLPAVAAVRSGNGGQPSRCSATVT